ncbi:unnamed protein product [Clonostachys solani]|uniref:Uncharacterized protein n=1 Tax=Clonostachys solani TaxID=160281 RepID=A0A9P0EGA9_9HYPO|nr:unnamed protein product [Clonostachys solani]
MKLPLSSARAVLGFAIALSSTCDAFAHERVHQHRHLDTDLEVRHSHNAPEETSLATRGGQCQFPTDDPNLVAVTPNAKNAGWAMSPDQECKPGSYCPFACKSGMVMAQWDPDSTYTYPASMNGGLYCNKNGEIEKPFKNSPNCVDGLGSINAVNKAGKSMSWCQTVLPGNEAMLIPTVVSSSAVIAVPKSSYWCSTAAHFYINPPGTGSEGCIWGDDKSPVGNWSPYVAGANADTSGQTFVKLGWNPIWEDSGLKGSTPDFGLRIECPDGGCNGLPCEIDPTSGSGNVKSNTKSSGAGGSSFCVVTVSKGKTANVVAFAPGGSSVSGGKDEEKKSTSTPSVAATSTVQSTSSSTVSSSSSSSSSPVSSTLTTVSSSSSSSSSSASSTSSPTSTEEPSTPTVSPTPSATGAKISAKPGIFHENDDSSSSGATATNSQSNAQPTEATKEASTTKSDEKGIARRKSGSPALVGLVVAFVAAAYFL